MALTPANIQAGARRFIWDETGVNLDLGLTLDSSTLVVERGGEEQLSEQFGIAPVDFIYAGTKATFRGVFREWGSLSVNDLLLTFLPGSTQSAGPTVREWNYGETAGASALTIARELTLRPEKLVSATPPLDKEFDIVFYKAVPLMMAEVPLDNGARSGVWSVAFLALVDTSRSSGNLLGRWKTQRV